MVDIKKVFIFVADCTSKNHMRLLIILLTFLLSYSLSAHARIDSNFAADYAEILDLLKESDANLRRYNAVNDSIFLPESKESWVNTFLRRARVCSDTYERSRYILSRVSELSSRYSSPDALDSLSRLPLHIKDAMADPFVYGPWFEQLANRYRPADLKDRRHLERYLYCLMQQTHAEDAFFRSGDTLMLKRFIEKTMLISKLLDAPDPSWRHTRFPMLYCQVYENIVQNYHVLHCGFMTLDQQIALHEQYQKQFPLLVRDSLISDAEQKVFSRLLSSFNSYLLRNVYLADTTHRYDRQRDSLQAEEVARYSDPVLLHTLSPSSQTRVHIARYRGGVQTAQQSLDSLVFLRRLSSPETLTNSNITPLLTNVLNSAYLIDVSTLAESQKHALILECCNEIYNLLEHKQYWISSQSINNSLIYLALYNRIHRHLTTDESRQFLLSLLFYTQPFTCAHSEMVSRLSLALLKGVIAHRPEMLVGVNGCVSAADVRDKEAELMDYLHKAALFHDLGKSRYPSIVHDEYRPLTDYEYQLLRKHAQYGLESLSVDSSYLSYHDIVVGHHKWYNGEGGYPEFFDNTKSPVRLLIDILAIADCLEAATSRLGRNYRDNKDYQMVLSEFRAGAGVRYNPDLVELMSTHEDIGDAMRQIVEKGWEDVYYQTFSLHRQMKY